MNIGNISVEEVQNVIKQLKSNKSKELLKWMDDNNKQTIAVLLTKCWQLEELPEQLTKANIVYVFKKGDTQNLEDYRPI